MNLPGRRINNISNVFLAAESRNLTDFHGKAAGSILFVFYCKNRNGWRLKCKGKGSTFYRGVILPRGMANQLGYRAFQTVGPGNRLECKTGERISEQPSETGRKVANRPRSPEEDLTRRKKTTIGDRRDSRSFREYNKN